MKNKYGFGLLAVVGTLVFALTSCSASPGGFSSSGHRDLGVADMNSTYSTPEMASLEEVRDFAESLPEEPAIIRTGSASIRVSDPVAAADEVTKLATSLGGSVESRYVNQSIEGRAASAELLVKIPSAKFDEAFNEFSTIGVLQNDQRSDNDVTLTKTDLTARVKALETSVTRLMSLLESASETSDLIEIETALSQRQQELDSLRAQLDSLQDQVLYSRVWVNLTTDQVIPGGPDNFWDGVVLGFQSFVKAMSAGLVILGILVPWITLAGIITLIIVIIVRAARKKKTREQQRN